jgi:hypothetical protein
MWQMQCEEGTVYFNEILQHFPGETGQIKH